MILESFNWLKRNIELVSPDLSVSGRILRTIVQLTIILLLALTVQMYGLLATAVLYILILAFSLIKPTDYIWTPTQLTSSSSDPVFVERPDVETEETDDKITHVITNTEEYPLIVSLDGEENVRDYEGVRRVEPGKSVKLEITPSGRGVFTDTETGDVEDVSDLKTVYEHAKGYYGHFVYDTPKQIDTDQSHVDLDNFVPMSEYPIRFMYKFDFEDENSSQEDVEENTEEENTETEDDTEEPTEGDTQ